MLEAANDNQPVADGAEEPQDDASDQEPEAEQQPAPEPATTISDTPAGADASARLYSLIETAKANDREPYAYLRHVFTDLPKATTLAEIEALLPWNVAPPATRGVAA